MYIHYLYIVWATDAWVELSGISSAADPSYCKTDKSSVRAFLCLYVCSCIYHTLILLFLVLFCFNYGPCWCCCVCVKTWKWSHSRFFFSLSLSLILPFSVSVSYALLELFLYCCWCWCCCMSWILFVLQWERTRDTKQSI